MSFYVLTVFFMMGGEAHAEARVTASLQECQIAGIQIMQAMTFDERVDGPQFICNRARAPERGA